jgi:Flp pilus assembly protein TadG
MIRLFANSRGNTTVEFAMVAPAFLSMLFLTIEGGRMVWTNQALKDVAFATARCMTVDAATCDTDAKRKTFAVTHAARSGITLAAADVTIQPNVTCDSNPAQNRVTVTEAFNSPVTGFFEAMPQNIVTHACFPVLS